MPIYMDRHDVSESVTAENVAQLHQQDLKIQHKFNCNGLTYWFDEKRKTAFCLIEAPDEQAIEEMHRQAHGEVPHRIIEVDPRIVESFLGRIEDPVKAKNTDLNIINDPAFRAIGVISLNTQLLVPEVLDSFGEFLQQHTQSIVDKIGIYDGRVVKQQAGHFLISFHSVTKAVECCLELRSHLSQLLDQESVIKLKLTLCAGVPVTNEDTLFEKAISIASRLGEIDKSTFVVTSEIMDLYTSENYNIPLKHHELYTLSNKDESFLAALMDFVEIHWNDDKLKVDDFNTYLGMSKASLYRRITDLTGKSPNSFLKEYRLKMALKFINRKSHSISEVTFMSGYSSPSYFSQSFQRRFGVLPSDYSSTLQSA